MKSMRTCHGILEIYYHERSEAVKKENKKKKKKKIRKNEGKKEKYNRRVEFGSWRGIMVSDARKFLG